jgi:hypothetical protein
MKDFKKTKVWQKNRQAALDIHKVTAIFPKKWKSRRGRS